MVIDFQCDTATAAAGDTGKGHKNSRKTYKIDLTAIDKKTDQVNWQKRP